MTCHGSAQQQDSSEIDDSSRIILPPEQVPSMGVSLTTLRGAANAARSGDESELNPGDTVNVMERWINLVNASEQSNEAAPLEEDSESDPFSSDDGSHGGPISYENQAEVFIHGVVPGDVRALDDLAQWPQLCFRFVHKTETLETLYDTVERLLQVSQGEITLATVKGESVAREHEIRSLIQPNGQYVFLFAFLLGVRSRLQKRRRGPGSSSCPEVITDIAPTASQMDMKMSAQDASFRSQCTGVKAKMKSAAAIFRAESGQCGAEEEWEMKYVPQASTDTPDDTRNRAATCANQAAAVSYDMEEDKARELESDYLDEAEGVKDQQADRVLQVAVQRGDLQENRFAGSPLVPVSLYLEEAGARCTLVAELAGFPTADLKVVFDVLAAVTGVCRQRLSIKAMLMNGATINFSLAHKFKELLLCKPNERRRMSLWGSIRVEQFE